METKAKKRVFNTIMVLLILVIAASAVVTVGKIQGWFGGEKETAFVSGKTRGVVNIERKGIGYTLKKDTRLEAGDLVETKKGAQVQLFLNDAGSIAVNGNTEVKITASEKENAGIEVARGEIFGDAVEYGGNLQVMFSGNTAMLSGAVFSVSVQSGSSTLQVYAGDISVTLADGTVERVEAGEYLSCVDGRDGKSTYSIEDIQIETMNEFLINQARECDSGEELCFTGVQLQQVLDNRAAEKQAALEASMKADLMVPAKEKATETEESGLSGENGKEAADSEPETVGTDTYRENQSTMEEYLPEAGNSSVQEPVSNAKICTIEIRCDTILNNMENLDDGKEAYVPANGTILATSSVEFEEGETVFDVLTRVCEYAGIQIEYSWTPMYNSYYIEGINHLYEFDCGNESGWMYKVNGWFPNYGCSSYDLEDGDVIVWCYTCNGLGADVGGPVH